MERVRTTLTMENIPVEPTSDDYKQMKISKEKQLQLIKIRIRIIIKKIEQIEDYDLIENVDNFFKLSCKSNEKICYNVTKILNEITHPRMCIYKKFIDELSNVV